MQVFHVYELTKIVFKRQMKKKQETSQLMVETVKFHFYDSMMVKKKNILEHQLLKYRNNSLIVLFSNIHTLDFIDTKTWTWWKFEVWVYWRRQTESVAGLLKQDWWDRWFNNWSSCPAARELAFGYLKPTWNTVQVWRLACTSSLGRQNALDFLERIFKKRKVDYDRRSLPASAAGIQVRLHA